MGKTQSREMPSILQLVNHLCCLTIAIWAVTPYLLRNGPEVVLLTAVILWICTACINVRRIGFGMMLTIIVLVFWLLWIISYRIIGISSAASGNYYVQVLFWFMFVVHWYYRQANSKRFQSFLRFFVSLAILANVVDNIRLLVIYPEASEHIFVSYGSRYLGMNVGATSFSFLCVLLYAGALIWFCLEKSAAIRLYCCLLMSGAVFYLLLSGRGTAFVLLLVFTALVSSRFVRVRVLQGNLSLYFGFLLFLLMISVVTFPLVVSGLSSVFVDHRLVLRLEEFVNLLYGHRYADVPATASTRISLSMISLESWLRSSKSFFIGIGDHRGSTISESVKYGIGNHAEFFDVFGRYGLIGAVVFFCLLISSLVTIRNQQTKSYWSMVVGVVFLYGLVNSITIHVELSVVLVLFIGNVLDVRLLHQPTEGLITK